jgi:hypothetical protein
LSFESFLFNFIPSQFSVTPTQRKTMLQNVSIMGSIQYLWSQLFSSRPPTALYEQILLLGDSITEFAEKQDLGFAFAAQLRAGEYCLIF